MLKVCLLRRVVDRFKIKKHYFSSEFVNPLESLEYFFHWRRVAKLKSLFSTKHFEFLSRLDYCNNITYITVLASLV